MKSLAAAALAGLLLLTAGCGGLSKDEKTASASIGKSFAGTNPSKARTSVGSCFGKTLVTEAGLDALKKDKVISAKLKATTTVPKKLSTKTAEAYGDGIVKCFDYTKLKGDIKKQTGATNAQVTKYVTCLGKIDDGDLKQAIVDQYTKTKATSAVTKVQKATTACAKSIGS